MRIDKFISEQAGVSRSDAKTMLKKGQVLINGSIVKSADAKIDPEKDIVTIGGKKISYRKFMYIMLNKPDGVVCATRDGLSSTVLELLPPELRRKGLFPAGRLDKDTEGFVFITDDGALAHKMLSPKNHVEKEYIVTLEKPAEKHYEELFASGMTIDGGEECLPARLTFTDNPQIVRLILHEGKYHQVKRMMEAAGNKVTHLKRIRMGGIELDPALSAGQCREITACELENLWE
ncbi:MAG: rRNA pseudouridine synthase [Ruminiclostridium sp.]|nr:rRNA pseudouridine synthase [Ruminiclostridium sp.]MBQ8826121.1 rRNA pseudouridine synthase [Oscillospiraceae bacterium]